MNGLQRKDAGMRPNSLATTLALGLVLAGSLQPAFARSGREEITPAEEREFPFDGQIPGCQDSSVLEQMSSQFAEKEAKFWNSNLTIVDYAQIKPLAWRPWGLDLIPRRYCTASATISTGRHHRIDYSVREDTNFIGSGWGVEWCVTGLDRNLAYAPACRMARP